MAGLADSRPGGIRPLTAQDVIDQKVFRGVINVSGAPISLDFESARVGVTETMPIPSPSQLSFTFIPKSAPADLWVYVDYSSPKGQ